MEKTPPAGRSGARESQVNAPQVRAAESQGRQKTRMSYSIDSILGNTKADRELQERNPSHNFSVPRPTQSHGETGKDPFIYYYFPTWLSCILQDHVRIIKSSY